MYVFSEVMVRCLGICIYIVNFKFIIIFLRKLTEFSKKNNKEEFNFSSYWSGDIVATRRVVTVNKKSFKVLGLEMMF